MCRKKVYRFVQILLLAVLVFSGTADTLRAELTYDPYVPGESTSSSGNGFLRAVWNLPALPFDLLRLPVRRALVLTEKYRLEKKARWLYDWVEERGVSPSASVVSMGNLGAGATVDFVRMLRQRENFPDLSARAWVKWTNDVIFRTGAETGIERLAGSDFHLRTRFEFEDRPEDEFYGIGPDTSSGEGANFHMETTSAEAVFGYGAHPMFQADFKLRYDHITIDEGDEGGKGQYDAIVTPRPFSGQDGDDLLSLLFQVTHDTRNRGRNSSSGGYQRILAGYIAGVHGSDAEYFKYALEAAHYFTLGNERRVLAVHVYGEHSDEINGREIPFHRMAKLGGFGAYPRLSQPLRGYRSNRFFDESVIVFNIEYRYNIWQYREFRGDTVFFWDEGQVFEEFSDFEFGEFRESYGIGLRITLAHIPVLSFELAHGGEGTRFYVKSSAPF